MNRSKLVLFPQFLKVFLEFFIRFNCRCEGGHAPFSIVQIKTLAGMIWVIMLPIKHGKLILDLTSLGCVCAGYCKYQCGVSCTTCAQQRSRLGKALRASLKTPSQEAYELSSQYVFRDSMQWTNFALLQPIYFFTFTTLQAASAMSLGVPELLSCFFLPPIENICLLLPIFQELKVYLHRLLYICSKLGNIWQ